MAKRDYYDVLGVTKSASKDDIKKIDLSKYPNGIYNLVVNYDKIRINKKIIKQWEY